VDVSEASTAHVHINYATGGWEGRYQSFTCHLVCLESTSAATQTSDCRTRDNIWRKVWRQRWWVGRWWRQQRLC